VKREHYITVKAANPPRAQFTAYPQDGEAPLAVTFLDLSWGYPTSRVWDFGDGTGSTEINPVHVYEKPGKYTVTLTVTNDAGSDTAIHKNFIKVSEKKHRMKGTGESEEGSGDTGLPQVPVSTPVPVTTQRPQIKIG
jgi:PKD repeat protein